MTDVLLLDFNGVIVNDERLHFETFRDVLKTAGVELGREEYEREFLGMGNDTIAFAKAGERSGGWEAEKIDELVRRKSRLYRERARQSLPLVDGAAEFVRAAAKVARIAVVSGAWRNEVEFGLEKAGIADVIEVIVAAEEIQVGKPEPEGFLLALERLGRPQGAPLHDFRVIVIEDSLPGLEAARKLGAGCVMIASSHQRETLTGADAIWDSFAGHDVRELEPLWRVIR